MLALNMTAFVQRFALCQIYTSPLDRQDIAGAREVMAAYEFEAYPDHGTQWKVIY